MELENVNPIGDNVVTSNLINVNFLIFENYENWVKKQRSYVMFSIRWHDCSKKQILILFTSQINIEWIEASHADTNLFYKKKI
jgi:hypothetical protein